MRHQCLINEETGDDNNDGIQDPVKTEARAKEILEVTGDHIIARYIDGDNEILRIRRDVAKTLMPLIESICEGRPGELLQLKSVIAAIDKDIREHETHIHNNAQLLGAASARYKMLNALGYNENGEFK